MNNLQYLITTLAYIAFGTALIVMCWKTPEIKDLTHLKRVHKRHPHKNILKKFLNYPKDSVIITRLAPLQQEICKYYASPYPLPAHTLTPGPGPTGSPTPGPRGPTPGPRGPIRNPYPPSESYKGLAPSNPYAARCNQLGTGAKGDMHKESETFQSLQTASITIGFILIFLAIFRSLNMLIN
jgi:hypothetical protein